MLYLNYFENIRRVCRISKSVVHKVKTWKSCFVFCRRVFGPQQRRLHGIVQNFNWVRRLPAASSWYTFQGLHPESQPSSTVRWHDEGKLGTLELYEASVAISGVERDWARVPPLRHSVATHLLRGGQQVLRRIQRRWQKPRPAIREVVWLRHLDSLGFHCSPSSIRELKNVHGILVPH